MALLPTSYRAVFDRSTNWNLEQKRRILKLVSSPFSTSSFLFQGNDVALFTFRICLNLNGPAVGRAEEDGKLIAESARYPLRCSATGVQHATFHVYVGQCQSAWASTVPQLLDASEVSASSLARLKNIVLQWFADRRTWMTTHLGPIAGLEDLPLHARRQQHELKDLFDLHESLLFNSTAMHSAWTANKTWFHLLMPFFHEHLGVPLSTWREPPPSFLGYPASHYAAPPPPPSSQGTRGFIGLPVSAAIVGALLAIRSSPTFPCKFCSQSGHSSWECPRNYYQTLGEACPGFDALGRRLTNAWTHGELTDAAKAQWITYIQNHSLTRSKQVSADVKFT